MPLKAAKPQAQEKRLKMFLFGGPGTGKTTAALNFPSAYFIDCERGSENYTELFNKNNSVCLHSTDFNEILGEVRLLATEKHEYKTVILDPCTAFEADLIQRAEQMYSPGDMRVWSYRDKSLRRLCLALVNLNMNVIVTSHVKPEYGPKMEKLGTVQDAWKRWPYIFDLVIELERTADGKRMGHVRKTRMQEFPDGDSFVFSYDELARRMGPSIAAPSTPVALATAEQVSEFKQLLEVVKIDADWLQTALAKNGVDEIEDLMSDKIAQYIAALKKKIGGAK